MGPRPPALARLLPADLVRHLVAAQPALLLGRPHRVAANVTQLEARLGRPWVLAALRSSPDLFAGDPAAVGASVEALFAALPAPHAAELLHRHPAAAAPNPHLTASWQVCRGGRLLGAGSIVVVCLRDKPS